MLRACAALPSSGVTPSISSVVRSSEYGVYGAPDRRPRGTNGLTTIVALLAPVLAPDDPIATDASLSEVVSAVAARRNDLEAPAISLQPVIADVLSALRAFPACRLARMSGSGATCFGLFNSASDAQAAARKIKDAQSGWWVSATTFG